MAGVMTPGAGWRSDPYRRHELRFWDGRAWTPHVSDLGVLGHDPVFPVTEGSAARTFLAPPARRRGTRSARSARDLAAAWAVGGFFAVVALAAVTAHRAPEATARRGATVAESRIAGPATRPPAAGTTTRTVTATGPATDTATHRTRPGTGQNTGRNASTGQTADRSTSQTAGQNTGQNTGRSAPPDRATPEVTPTPPRPGTSSPALGGLPPAPVPVPRPDSSPPPPAYAGCAEVNVAYPHGVGVPGARDQTSGRPVTAYTVDPAAYWSNMRLDADHDGIACEHA